MVLYCVLLLDTPKSTNRSDPLPYKNRSDQAIHSTTTYKSIRFVSVFLICLSGAFALENRENRYFYPFAKWPLLAAAASCAIVCCVDLFCWKK